MKKAVLFLITAMLCFAQDGPVSKYYRFDFAVKELDAGKVQTTKNYSAISSGRPSQAMSIRSGEKVPVGTGAGQMTFLDVGVNIDCRIFMESATELGMTVTSDISSADSRVPPVVTQTKWNSNVVVALKKPTLIFSSESPSKKVQTQLEVTITPLQ